MELRHILRIDWLSPTPESIVVESIHILPLRHARLGNGTLCMRRDAKVRNGKLYFFNFSATENTLPSERAFR